MPRDKALPGLYLGETLGRHLPGPGEVPAGKLAEAGTLIFWLVAGPLCPQVSVS